MQRERPAWVAFGPCSPLSGSSSPAPVGGSIGAWIVAAVVITMTAPALQSTQDQSEFLPSHYESVQALTVQQEAFPRS